MANYVDSALLAFQSRINKKFSEAELREQQNPILSVGLANQDYLVTNPQAVRESTSRAVKGYQHKRRAASNGTTRAYNHTGSQGDSQEVTLNWGTFSETMSILLTLGDDNVIKRPEILDNSIMQVQRILRERIGKYNLEQLHAARTGASNATVKNATFNATTDTFLIDDEEMFWANIASVMRQHKYYEKLDVLTDSVLFPKYRKLYNQGTNNGTNSNFQFSDFNNVWEHTLLGTDVATDYSNGTAIVLPQNSFAFIPWVPAINRKGHGDYESYLGGYGTLPDATGLPLTYAVHGYAQRVDGSAAGGSAQDVRLELEISIDVAFQAQELSAADETPIYEFALSA